MLDDAKKRDAGNLALDMCKLDQQNQELIDHAVKLLLASQALHDSRPPTQHDPAA